MRPQPHLVRPELPDTGRRTPDARGTPAARPASAFPGASDWFGAVLLALAVVVVWALLWVATW